RIAGLVGIASAPDFTEYLIWDVLSDTQKHTLMHEGIYTLPSEYSPDPYPITRELIEEGRNHLLLQKEIPLHCPVRLLHGMKDSDVPYSLSLTLSEKLSGSDVRILLTKNGDHRMSGEEELALLATLVKEQVEKNA